MQKRSSDRTLKIGLVSDHASPLAARTGSAAGGQSVHVDKLARGLSRIGHDVTVYTRRTARDQPQVMPTAQGYVVVHLPAGPPEPLGRDAVWPHMVEFSHALGATLDARRPDVLHGHYWMSAWATRFAAVPRHIPWTVTFHALDSVRRRHPGLVDTSPRDRSLVERQLARRAGRIIATCREEVSGLLALGLERPSIALVPYGVDLQTFSPRGRSDTANGPVGRRERFRIVSVGRLSWEKGFDLLVSALARIPDTELVIAGGGPPARIPLDPEAIRLRRLAVDLGVQDRVRLIGQVEQARMPGLLRSADVVVCCPVYEPYCTVAVEAMACGVPVVATAVSGLWDVVVNGVTGTLVAGRDPARLAAAVRSLLDEPARRRAYGLAARIRAERRHSWTRTAELSVASYRRATQR